ncbi:L-threonine 3-dehydrogenase [Flavobacteriaceae bacterium UJ101]|nr:L-threonine 3-dehydrogenase [Flavobacteriaceae bacterium UJ101]
MSNEIIIVTGASGQIGSDLVLKLRELYGNDNVIATDIKDPSKEVLESGPFEEFNVMNRERLQELIKQYKPTQIYHLAAMLSATGEKMPLKAWDLNMNSLLSILEEAREGHFKRVFFPSSIAVYGRNIAREQTPQHSPKNPSTVYGISKLAGEKWCEYYYNRYGVDVRSLRYPGLISWKTEAGGGTTDYAVDIFYKALSEKKYTSFLSASTALPMMYMDDAIKATIDLMQADEKELTVRSSYNLGGISFAPKEIAAEIKKHIPEFKIDYEPDYRQTIADTWPISINDTSARTDWNWQHNYNLEDMVKEMLTQLKEKLNVIT